MRCISCGRRSSPPISSDSSWPSFAARRTYGRRDRDRWRMESRARGRRQRHFGSGAKCLTATAPPPARPDRHAVAPGQRLAQWLRQNDINEQMRTIAGVGDGALLWLWLEDLSPEPWSAARWRHLSITVPGRIIILITAPLLRSCAGRLLRQGYGPAPGGDAVAYCTRRYKSYDPRSGTYLGTDGHSHPCP
jgi:hypothetical protein